MAWIESNEELAAHPKTKKAARLLEITIPTMLGHLHLLWWWCLKYAQDGDLSQYEAADLADAAAWEGDATRFVRALLDCGPGESFGFLEEIEDGGLMVHDWMDYAGKLIERRQANALRMKDARAKHVHRMCEATVPNLTNNINNNDRAREEISPSAGEPTQSVNEIQKNVNEPKAIGTQAVAWAEEHWGRPIAPGESETIIGWCDSFASRGSPEPNDLVVEGLRQCLATNARNLNYLRAVMLDWLENGILTVAQVTARDAERKKQKGHKRGPREPSARGPSGTKLDKYEDFYL